MAKEVALEVKESGDDQSADKEIEEQQARVVKRPHDPGKPTRKEMEEHLPTHWPFRSWCRHCVSGRCVASPHKSRSQEDKEFPRRRMPTISMDHCFLGSEKSEDMAHGNPC